MGSIRAFLDYWAQAVRLLEAQFFVLVERYYHYFFDGASKGDDDV
jgi:hypothetical protein